MLAALLAAGTCAFMPSFNSTGPPCTPTNQAVECRCDECIQWDPVPGATSYKVNRLDIDGTNNPWTITGSVTKQGVVIPPVPIWCPAKTPTLMPREGNLYKFSFAACNPAGCSAFGGMTLYIGAPYAINKFNPPVKGN
jgi:hypothetical protein